MPTHVRWLSPLSLVLRSRSTLKPVLKYLQCRTLGRCSRQKGRLCRLSVDLESPAEVGGNNGEVSFFFFFGSSVEWEKQQYRLGYRFPSTPWEGEHQRQDPQGGKSTARPKAASHTHSFPSEAIPGTGGETEAAATCAESSLSAV